MAGLYYITNNEDEMKHTPGEWHAVQYANYINIQSGPYYGDANILNAEEVTEDKAIANGKLMAAAPELLKTCELVYDILNQEEVSVENVSTMIHACVAVIKKATE